MDEKIESLLAEILQVPRSTITNDLTMKDVDAWDSLKHMELVVSLEHAFNLELTFDEIVIMQSVGEIKRVISQRSAS